MLFPSLSGECVALDNGHNPPIIGRGWLELFKRSKFAGELNSFIEVVHGLLIQIYDRVFFLEICWWSAHGVQMWIRKQILKW